MRPPPWKYYYWCLPWWLKAIICIIYARLQLRLRFRVSLYRCIAVSLFSSGRRLSCSMGMVMRVLHICEILLRWQNLVRKRLSPELSWLRSGDIRELADAQWKVMGFINCLGCPVSSHMECCYKFRQPSETFVTVHNWFAELVSALIGGFYSIL